MAEIDNEIHHSNHSGDFIFIVNIDNINCMIKFLTTGYMTRVEISKAYKGQVRDPYYPSIYGVACVGITNIPPKHKARILWMGMVSRCYNEKDTHYQYYGGAGIKVSDKWKCFEYFYEDLPRIPGYDLWEEYGSQMYHLDKDKLQMNVPKEQRVYSLETCCFISYLENKQLQNLSMKDTYDSPYLGVRKARKNFTVGFTYNNTIYRLGSYSNEIAAANRYIHFTNMLGLYYVQQDVPYMTPQEVASYKLHKDQMYSLVKRQMYTLVE